MVKTILPRKHTEIHGRKDEGKIVMATESTEEHGKIKPINIFGALCVRWIEDASCRFSRPIGMGLFYPE
jgi:hypothetical protein